MLDKSDTKTRAQRAHSLQNALPRALDALRQIIGEESGLLHGDTFAIECRDLRDTHPLNTNSIRASRSTLTGAVRMRVGLSLIDRCRCVADALRL